jgi:anti-sigma factor RsiW
MKCEGHIDLVAYHFNVLHGDDRRRVERHLVECAACIGSFIEVKRGIEEGEDAPGPSKGARAAIRRAVAVELGIRENRSSWWERPVALAVAASVVVGASLTTHALASVAGVPPHAMAQNR